MTKIGLISDTHGIVSKKVIDFFTICDEIWHAGDIGNIETVDIFEKMGPFKAVFGNIDGNQIRSEFPKEKRFHCEKVDVLITHIGGQPGRYEKTLYNTFHTNPPNLFICGHSHILRVKYDKDFNFLYVNPGAAGKFGFHHVCTAIRFEIDNTDIKNLEVLEFPRS